MKEIKTCFGCYQKHKFENLAHASGFAEDPNVYYEFSDTESFSSNDTKSVTYQVHQVRVHQILHHGLQQWVLWHDKG